MFLRNGWHIPVIFGPCRICKVGQTGSGLELTLENRPNLIFPSQPRILSQVSSILTSIEQEKWDPITSFEDELGGGSGGA